jgi:hypothetical protein
VLQQPFQPDTPLLSTHPYTTFKHNSYSRPRRMTPRSGHGRSTPDN